MGGFVRITYNTHPFIRKVVLLMNYAKYKIMRPLVSFLSYYLLHTNKFKEIHKRADGKALKPGISVYIPCKNEETHLMKCLESLLPIVDHFILIDNGSEDATLEIMYEFKEKYKTESEIEVYPQPDMLLVEMVQFALSKVKYSWVLKWDGDMLAINDDNQFSQLRARCLKSSRPKAYTLPRINLAGDYSHVSSWSKIVDAGEPFLRTYNNRFVFTEEFGRLEHAVIPLYYKKVKLKRRYFSFHFSNLRPPIRIMYRHCYLDWRETINNGTTAIKEKYDLFEDYRKDWFLHNFGSSYEPVLKYRSGRLIASMCKKFDVNKYCQLPARIQEEINSGTARFNILYKDHHPYLMMDNEDSDMTDYTESEEDKRWEANYNLFFNDSQRMNF
ncbi:MAG: glycosyltransferase [Bacteroidota bacterium]